MRPIKSFALATFVVVLLGTPGPHPYAAHVAAAPVVPESGSAEANDANAPLSRTRFELVVLRAAKQLIAYRLDTISGETWSLAGISLIRIKEKGPVPQGNFELAVIPTKDGKQHWLVRMDRRSGSMWYATNNQWTSYAENP